ncbi:heme-dependent oxidative N-demethylase family protein [Gottfriedia acidiceleris]|uniref:heme-dependent oxidative N-demethylase family protein n=1 Tax=Gottfriedia acidiceleris TaxID=371036 RepID=UPI003D1C9534
MNQVNELESFPYPFKEEIYRYSNNSILLDPPVSIEITNKYENEIKLKRSLLLNSPSHCYQALPTSFEGQWEIVELVLDHLTRYYPNYFEIHKGHEYWTIYNKLLMEEEKFRFWDRTSVLGKPLNFIGRHVQEDLIYMSQRDGDLFLDAGHLCFPSNWSLTFKLGMRFKEIHQPIPMFNEKSLDDRILRFLKNIEQGTPWTRKNWSLMAGKRLDTSLETFNEWGKDRKKVTADNVGNFVHLRVEVQKLFRLSASNGLLFTIHTHLLPLEQLSLNKEWLEQFYKILCELPDFILDYKGISSYKKEVITYLKNKLDEVG